MNRYRALLALTALIGTMSHAEVTVRVIERTEQLTNVQRTERIPQAECDDAASFLESLMNAKQQPRDDSFDIICDDPLTLQIESACYTIGYPSHGAWTEECQ